MNLAFCFVNDVKDVNDKRCKQIWWLITSFTFRVNLNNIYRRKMFNFFHILPLLFTWIHMA